MVSVKKSVIQVVYTGTGWYVMLVDLISRGGKGGKRNKVTIADSAVSTLRQ
jgi:hypothetical protein